MQLQEVLAEYQLVLTQGSRSAGLSKEEKVEMAAKQMRKIKVSSYEQGCDAGLMSVIYRKGKTISNSRRKPSRPRRWNR